MSVNKSSTLNEHFETNNYTEETLSYLKNLKNNHGLDPEVFKHFEDKVLAIIDKNPGSEDIVNNELEKTNLMVEASADSYTRAFRSILNWDSINNMDYNPDEDMVA